MLLPLLPLECVCLSLWLLVGVSSSCDTAVELLIVTASRAALSRAPTNHTLA